MAILENPSDKTLGIHCEKEDHVLVRDLATRLGYESQGSFTKRIRRLGIPIVTLLRDGRYYGCLTLKNARRLVQILRKQGIRL